jgi:hypothetical protein
MTYWRVYFEFFYPGHLITGSGNIRVGAFDDAHAEALAIALVPNINITSIKPDYA